MKNVFKLATGFAAAAVLLSLSAGAQAQGYPDVSWNINVGTPGAVYAPAPVYRQPPPVVVAPAPVVYAAPMVVHPRPVVVAPAPVYYGAPGWRHGHGHGHRHEHWEHGRGHGRH